MSFILEIILLCKTTVIFFSFLTRYDCPEDATTYLHRVGRTARNAAVGQSLLVLLPSEETGMSQQLRAHKIPVDKIEVNPKKMTDIHRKIQAHLASDTQVWSLHYPV